MISLDSYLDGITTVAISGHIRPDGDCVGSCLAVYNYICDNYPTIMADLYLEPIPEKFLFLKNADKIRHMKSTDGKKEYDLFIALDCGDVDRLGLFGQYFEVAKSTFCVDHHISNQSFADFNYIFPNASSTSELVYQLMDESRITKEIAECIYLGIVHDTGVFQYSCTSSKTMEIAGQLMDKGIDYSRIVDDTFYIRTFAQQQILGKALMDAELHFNGTCISSVVKRKQLEKFHVEPKDLDGIVGTLRSTAGVEAAVFVYPNENDTYKVSLRSASYMDVAQIAMEFGGGGHSRAAGVSMEGKPDEILKKVLAKMKKQLKDKDTEEDGCTTES